MTITLFENEKQLILKALNELRAKEYTNYLYGNLKPEERGFAENNYKEIDKLIKVIENGNK